MTTTEQDANRWKALIVALLAGSTTPLAVSIIDVALPPVRADLNPCAGVPQRCRPHTP